MIGRLSSRLSILVVDADQTAQAALHDAFTQWDAGRVLSAADPAEAMAILRREPVDALVTDWLMEPVGGAEFLRWVRTGATSPEPEIPVIVRLDHADVPTVRAAWQAGADTVLAKPVTPLALARRIDTVLSRPRRPGRLDPLPSGITVPPEPEAGSPSLPALTAPQTPLLGTPEPPIHLAQAVNLLPPGALARRVRLAGLVDRLEHTVDQPRQTSIPGGRLHTLSVHLLRTSVGEPLVHEIAASLAVLVAGVRPSASGFTDAVHAHMAGLRWALGGDDGGEAAARALVQCLRSTVRLLLRQSPSAGSVASRPSTGSQRLLPH